MIKVYTVEVVKESRALITIEAENGDAMREEVRKMDAEGKIEWKMKDHLTMEVVNSRDKKG